MENTRRTFLKQATGIAALSVGTPAWLSVSARSPVEGRAGLVPSEAEWYDKPMRWAQLAFVEDDPGNYDLAFWLDYFKRIHADAACLSAGGVVAFYPTDVPLHYRSKWLGNGDAFGDIVAGCRKQGMKILARTDPHACHQDVYDAHPDWISEDEHGNKRRHPADPSLWLTCVFGGYSFEFMTAIHVEITKRYMPDGIFTNRWQGIGICYCATCRKNFKEFSGGLDIPVTHNGQDPARKAYTMWVQKILFAQWRLWDAKIREINPNGRFIGNAGGGALSDLDMKTIGELAPTLFADRQGRSGLTPPWMNGKNAKEYRSTMGGKPVGGIFSVGVEERPRWKDSVQSADEIRLWVAEGTAQGMRPWFTKFNAKLIDRRWLPVVEEIYGWHFANESYLRNVASLARVAMVYSQQTAWFYGGEDAKTRVEDPALGFYQALVEARIPFEMVHDGQLSAEHLKPYSTLILPNIAALSDAQCLQLRAFVERGGSVVATFETSLYDEGGVRRKDFGLGSLFGARWTGEVKGPINNSYLELEHGERAHALVKGMDDVPRIINADYEVSAQPLSTSMATPVRIIPSYPDLPMEEVFQRTQKTSGPGAYVSQHGKGRVVYFPGDIDRTFWNYLNVDQGKLLANAVRWAMGAAEDECLPVEVRGKGVVDVAVWRQKSSMTVHLVNLTNPMMMKGPLREVIPMPPQEVRLRVPAGVRVTGAKLLVAGGAVPIKREGDMLVITVATAGIGEVIGFDFA